MQFFQSFYSLGYSGIVLVIAALFVGTVLFNLLRMHKRHWLAKAVLFIVLAVAFVFVTNYLSDQRKIMIDAIRDEGGLKRTQTK